MRILVTGGAGFIGSHIVEAYFREGHEVAVFDDLSSGSMDNLKALEKEFDGNRLHIYHGSITDPRIVRWVFDSFKPEIVNHQAAKIDMAECEENEALATFTNVVGTENLLKYSAEFRKVKLFIFASSAGAIYGETPEPWSADKGLESLPEPKSVYGKTKLAAEKLICRSGIPSVILRYSNVYGPRARAGVIPAFARAVKDGKAVTIFGDGEQVRDFVHVEDVAQANVKALTSRSLFKIFDVSFGESRSVNEVFRQFKPLSDREDPFEAIYEASRGFEVLESRVLAHLAKEELGWIPQISFEEGIRALMRESFEEKEEEEAENDPRRIRFSIEASGLDETIAKLERILSLKKEIESMAKLAEG